MCLDSSGLEALEYPGRHRWQLGNPAAVVIRKLLTKTRPAREAAFERRSARQAGILEVVDAPSGPLRASQHSGILFCSRDSLRKGRIFFRASEQFRLFPQAGARLRDFSQAPGRP